MDFLSIVVQDIIIANMKYKFTKKIFIGCDEL